MTFRHIYFFIFHVFVGRLFQTGEYECGGKMDYHVHRYSPRTDNGNIGHFKLNKKEYKINRDERNRKESCCKAKAAFTAKWNSLEMRSICNPGKCKCKCKPGEEVRKCFSRLWSFDYCKRFTKQKTCSTEIREFTENQGKKPKKPTKKPRKKPGRKPRG